MTASNQSIKRKLSLLALAEELQNVSRACQLMGYHRDSFYEIKRAFQAVWPLSSKASGGLAARTPIASRLRSKRGSWAPT